MNNPEVSFNEQEPRREFEPERDTCLRSLLSQVEGRAHRDVNPADDRYLLEGLDKAFIGVDEDNGEYILACQQPGCEAFCIMALRTSGSEGTITVQNSVDLDACTYEG